MPKQRGQEDALNSRLLQDYVLQQIRDKRAKGEELTPEELQIEASIAAKRAKKVPLNKRIVQQIREPVTVPIREARDSLLSAITRYLQAIAPDARDGAAVVIRGSVIRSSPKNGDFDFTPRLTEATRKGKLKRDS